MQTRTKESQVLSQVYSELQERFNHFDDPAHGWEHIQRVYDLAMRIAEQEGADGFVTGMAVLLHDLGRLSHEQGQHHADLSEIVERELLNRQKVTLERQEAILHAIVAHSF